MESIIKKDRTRTGVLVMMMMMTWFAREGNNCRATSFPAVGPFQLQVYTAGAGTQLPGNERKDRLTDRTRLALNCF